MDFFNDQVVKRKEQQIHIAIRFSHPQMKKAAREAMLLDDKFFKPDWHITNTDEL